MKGWLPIGAAAWLVVAGASPLAEEQKNMSPGMATEMENAFPVPFRAIQFQNVVRFEDSNQGDKIYRVEPEPRWGLVPTIAVALGAEVGLSRSAPDYQVIIGY